MAEAGTELLQPFEMARQVFIHPLGVWLRLVAGDADGVIAAVET